MKIIYQKRNFVFLSFFWVARKEKKREITHRKIYEEHNCLHQIYHGNLKNKNNYWNTIPYVHFAQNSISYVHFAQNSIFHAHFAQNSISHVHFAQNSIFHEIEFFSCSLHEIKKRTRPASSITLKILESKKKKKKYEKIWKQLSLLSK